MSNVQFVLTDAEYHSFEDAAAHQVRTVKDGDPLWAYIRYPGPARDFTSHTPDSYDPTDRDRRAIIIAVGPDGSDEIWQEGRLDYQGGELDDVTDVTFCLTAGKPGYNRSDPTFVYLVAHGAPGVWDNAISLLQRVGYDDAEATVLAKAPITVDVAGGFKKYKRLSDDYAMDIARGEQASNAAPDEGRYVDKAMAAEILAELDNRGFEVEKFYFTCDDWEITGYTGPEWKRITAAFLYHEGGQAYYGNAIHAYQYIPELETWKNIPNPLAIETDFPLTEDQFDAAPGAVEAAKPATDATPPAASATDDMAAQLTKLAELHAAGILTDAEFSAKKAQILGL